jgi:glycosyltransferase involved in cell wall biosynthesis
MTDFLENPSGKKRILFGFNSVPYPLRADGVAVRYLPIIEYMSQRHEVDLLVISGGAEESPNLDGLRSYCRKIFVLQDPRQSHKNMLKKCKTYANFLLPWTPPLSVMAHDGSMTTRGIVEATKGEHYDAMVWVGGDLLSYLIDALPSMSVGKVFIDFVDSPFLWATRRKEKPFRFKLLDRYEQWKTCRWEGDVIRRADGTIYISHVDAEVIPSGHAPMEKRHVVPNGINIPSGVNTERVSLPSPNIGFLGNMGYPPNIEAVEWLYKEVFVPLRKSHPDLTLVVIGRYPSQSILDLGEKPGVIVTGAVDDVWPYINGIDVFLFPLLRGAGLKNKILEAMYGRRPVVTTGIGNEGIDAIPGQEFVLCRTAKDFQREAIRLLNSPEERTRMGNSACKFVNEKFSWGPILSAYENLTLGTMPASDPGCNRKKDSLAPAMGSR